MRRPRPGCRPASSRGRSVARRGPRSSRRSHGAPPRASSCAGSFGRLRVHSRQAFASGFVTGPSQTGHRRGVRVVVSTCGERHARGLLGDVGAGELPAAARGRPRLGDALGRGARGSPAAGRAAPPPPAPRPTCRSGAATRRRGSASAGARASSAAGRPRRPPGARPLQSRRRGGSPCSSVQCGAARRGSTRPTTATPPARMPGRRVRGEGCTAGRREPTRGPRAFPRGRSRPTWSRGSWSAPAGPSRGPSPTACSRRTAARRRRRGSS